MKKIKSIFKKIVFSIITFISTLLTNVSLGIQLLYGPPEELGIVVKTEPETSTNWPLLIGKLSVIPIVFLVGIIIYLKKSKKSTKIKIVTTIITTALVAAVTYLGYKYLMK